MARLNYLLFTALVFSAVGAENKACDSHCQLAFSAFIKKYERSYATEEERQARLEIFQKNYAFVQTQNAKNLTYKLEINAFADQSVDEIKAGRLGLMAPPSSGFSGLPHLGTDRYSGKALPTSIDWVKKGAVTTPKNQGQCGSCWTFSTTGALEGAWQIATGKLVSLSEQQFVDCSHDMGSKGCQGGAMDGAFTYAEQHGICTEDSYTYKAADGECKATNCDVGIKQGSVTGYRDVTPQDLDSLMEAVAQQPVSVAIEADQMAFQLYKGGILTKECDTKLDHGVLVVGYGTEDGVDYWKVKNSWGPTWGEEGFIRLERGKSADGECGVKDAPTYPVVSAAAERSSVIV